MANTKTLAIKARLANHIRKTLYAKKRLENFTEDQKVEFFNDIYSRYLEMHSELNAYKAKRKKKAAIQKERQARGYYLIKKEKKQSSKEYLKTTNNVQSS